MGIKIVCSVWRKPDSNKRCETFQVEITEDEILDLAVKKHCAITGYLESDVYNNQLEHIVP